MKLLVAVNEQDLNDVESTISARWHADWLKLPPSIRKLVSEDVPVGHLQSQYHAVLFEKHHNKLGRTASHESISGIEVLAPMHPKVDPFANVAAEEGARRTQLVAIVDGKELRDVE